MLKGRPMHEYILDLSKESFVSEVAPFLLEYFSKRWGQGAPLPEVEATQLAEAIWEQAQKRDRGALG